MDKKCFDKTLAKLRCDFTGVTSGWQRPTVEVTQVFHELILVRGLSCLSPSVLVTLPLTFRQFRQFCHCCCVCFCRANSKSHSVKLSSCTGSVDRGATRHDTVAASRAKIRRFETFRSDVVNETSCRILRYFLNVSACSRTVRFVRTFPLGRIWTKESS